MPKRAREFTQHIVKAKPKDRPFELRDGKGNGLLIRVQPTGQRTWYVVLPSGKRYKLGDVNKYTLTKARERAANYRWHKGPPPEELERALSEEGVPSLGKFLDKQYIPHFEAHHDEVKHLDNFKVMEALRHYPLNQLTAAVLDDWVQVRLDPSKARGLKKKDAKPVSKATVRRNLGALRSALMQAVKWGIIPASPLQHYAPIKQADQARTRYLTDDERVRLLKALDEDDAKERKRIAKERAWVMKRYKDEPTKLHARLNGPKLHAPWLKSFVLLALNTGARQGQLRKLEWRDINPPLTAKRDNLHRTLTLRPETAKTKRINHVPLNAQAVDALRLMPIGGPDDAVFPGRKQKFITNPNGPWKRVLKAAKIPDFSFHDLRHSFASSLVNKGVDLYRVQRLLTHSDAKLTQRYAHLDPEYLRDAVEKLNG